MRVRDLLPDKDALITREYWLKRSQLGQPILTYIPTCLPMTPFGIPGLRYGIPIGEEGQNPNWRYSSTRNPNLMGLAFGSEGGKFQPEGWADRRRAGLREQSQNQRQLASGMNDRYTPSHSAPQTTTYSANGSKPGEQRRIDKRRATE